MYSLLKAIINAKYYQYIGHKQTINGQKLGSNNICYTNNMYTLSAGCKCTFEHCDGRSPVYTVNGASQQTLGAGPMLGQVSRQWASISPTLDKRPVLTGLPFLQAGFCIQDQVLGLYRKKVTVTPRRSVARK